VKRFFFLLNAALAMAILDLISRYGYGFEKRIQKTDPQYVRKTPLDGDVTCHDSFKNRY
jgi:hypothetical protein